MSKSTALSTEKQFTQSDIPSLLESVNAKIDALTKSNNIKPVVTAILPGFNTIANMNDLSTLLQACANVEHKEKAFNEMAAKHLPEGTKAPKFQIEGSTSKEWLEALDYKIIEVVHKKDLETLRQIKSTLESNLSQEMKLANDLKSINELLNGE